METKTTKQKPTPRDEGYAWVIVISAFFLQAIQDGIRFSYGLFFVEFLEEFKKNKAQTAWIGSIMLSVFNLGGPVYAYIVNRFGYRVGTMAGAIITVTGLLLSYIAPNLYYLYFTYGALQGFGFGMVFLSGYVATVTYFKRRRALAVGITFCGGGIGTFTLLPLAQRMIGAYGWRGAMFILAGVALNECVCASLLRPFVEEQSEADKKITSPKETTKDEKYSSGGKKEQTKDTECISLLQLKNKNDDSDIKLMPTADEDDKERDDLVEIKKYNQTKFYVSRSYPDIHSERNCLVQNKSLSLNMIPLVNSHNDVKAAVAHDPGNNETCVSEPPEITQPDCSQNLESSNTPLNLGKGKHQTNIEKENKFQNKFIEKLCPKELVTNTNFIILVLSTVFIAIPEFVPYSMLPDFALNVNCSQDQSAWTLSVVGVGAMVSQVGAGWLADMNCVHNLSLLGGCLIAIGVTTMIMAVIPMFETLITYSALYGMLSGAMYSVQPIVMLEYIGEKYMTSMQGLLMWVYGISGLIGTPAAGWLFDATGSYTTSFLSAGACFVFSGLINFLVLCTPRSNDTVRGK